MAVKYPKILGNCILMKTPKETKSKGGIELPTSVVENMKMAGKEGIAVKVGKDVLEISKGDRVLPKDWVGNAIENDQWDQDYWYVIISEDDILAVWPTN